jgi:hypothetical protein
MSKRTLNKHQAAVRRFHGESEEVGQDAGYFIVDEDLSPDRDVAPYRELNERLHNEEV